MRKQIERVHYTNPDEGSFSVERLQPDDVSHKVARQVRQLVGVAYAGEFESPRTPSNLRLPSGRISHGFVDDDPKKIEQHQMRIENALAIGSTYWLVRLHQEGADDPNGLDGLIKTTPSRASVLQKLHVTSPNCYIDDIMTRPRTQNAPGARGKGIGAALLYTALQHDRYKPSAVVVADTYQSGHTGPEFFHQAGFTINRDSHPSPTVFNVGEEDEIHLPMNRVEARAADVAQRLAAQFDWLAHAEVAYSA